LFRNYIYWGVCSNIDDIGWLINCVKNNGNKKLSNNYKN
jgi:bisphosphoglycerate-independent phosphoglycerate mutase (AlkP superfamily)